MFRILQERFAYFLVAFLLLPTVLFAEERADLLMQEKLQYANTKSGFDTSFDKKGSSDFMTSGAQYLQGDVELLSHHAPQIVSDISNTLYQETGIQVFINVVKDTPQPVHQISHQVNERFQNRRNYEKEWLDKLDGKYAVIFLFYSDHSLTLKSNVNFINTQELLENYAYPYLPAESVGTDKYNDGVNEGVSNLYLALAHKIATYYSFDLKAPKPLEQPSDVTKVIIYAMLFVMLGLFILVRFGLLAYKNKKG